MTEISFYGLQKTNLESVLPRLLEKILERGMRAVAVAGSEQRVAELNAALWIYGQGSFLPHGAFEDGHAAEQPVFLTADPTANPNGAQVLALTDGATTDDFDGFERVLEVLDGKDEAMVAAARNRWLALKKAGHALTYWQQTSKGWEKKNW